MLRLLSSPARDRLEWILEGLDGATGWGADATGVFSPEFTKALSAQSYVERTRQRVERFAPVVVVGVDVAEHLARARLRDNTGEISVLHVAVEPEPPHRITGTYLADLVPVDLAPRLPMDFTEYPLTPATEPVQLVVFSGLPGSGKSQLADAVGRATRVPVFAVDWLLGALSPFGLRHHDRLVEVGEELLTTLALRQLAGGQSAILDSPLENPKTRQRWRSLAARAGADFVAVLCECTDQQVHRARVEDRSRGIPGWYDAGDWNNVSRRRAAFPPWPDDVLRIDTTRPNDANVAAVMRHLRERAAARGWRENAGS